MESLLIQTRSSQAVTVLKRTLSLVFFGEYIYVNIFFQFYFFVLEKTKAATGDVLRKKVFLIISQISQEDTCVKKRLQHMCFLVKFGKLLRTTILKKISERMLLKRSIFVFLFGIYFNISLCGFNKRTLLIPRVYFY